MSYEHLYIIVKGDKKAKKSAENSFWLWEEGAIIGFIPMIVVLLSIAALDTRHIFYILLATLAWLVEIFMLNLHELFYCLRLKIYLKSGRVLECPDDLKYYVCEKLGVHLSKHGGFFEPVNVSQDTLDGLSGVFRAHATRELNAPDKRATHDNRIELSKAQTSQVLEFELERRMLEDSERKRLIAEFNQQQDEERQLYDE